MAALVNLASACLTQNSFEDSYDYARAATAMLRGTDGQAKPPDMSQEQDVLANILTTLARSFYYEKENFERAAETARMAADLDSSRLTDPILPLSLMRLERMSQAADAWSSVIAAHPAQGSYHNNYAGTLIQLDRLEEALKELQEAVRLDPAEVRWRMGLANLLCGMNREEEAIPHYGKIIEISEREAQASSQRHQPRSRLDYERNMPPTDIAEFARISRIQAYRKLKKWDEALADAEILSHAADDATVVAGLELKGSVEQERGHYSEALLAFNQAVETRPENASPRLVRADLRLLMGDLDSALADLRFAADRNRQPKEAVAALEKIAASHPDSAAVRKCLGFAYLEAWNPAAAERTLTEAIAALPQDADLFFWRGMARITFDVSNPKSEWNESATGQRLRDAVTDLTTSLRLAPNQQDALIALKWVVDRVAVSTFFREWLTFSNLLDDVLPQVADCYRRFFGAIRLGSQREWQASLDEFLEIQGLLAAADMPVSAAEIHVHLADTRIRLDDLQGTLDELASAKNLLLAIAQPLTQSLRERALTTTQASQKKSGVPSANFEIDYFPVYGVGTTEFNHLVNFLEAQVYSRLGDHPRALQALEKLGDVLQHPDRLVQESIGLEGQIGIAVILREADQKDRAIEFLNRLEPLCKEENQKLRLHHARGTVFLAKDQPKEALAAFRAARAAAAAVAPNLVAGIDVNIASCCYHLGRKDEALKILGSVDIEHCAESKRQRFAYYVLTVQICGDLGRTQEAVHAARTALDIWEDRRTSLRRFENRMSWQAEGDNAYKLAITAALGDRDISTAFDFVERSRARTFVDQLEFGNPPLPESLREMDGVQTRLLEQRKILAQIQGSIRRHGVAYVDYEAVRQLTALDESRKVVEEGPQGTTYSEKKITEEMSRIDTALSRLFDEREDARLTSIVGMRGAIAGVQEVRALLNAVALA
jgi:tetratricopeptide (TPR) repeat protein